MKKLTLLSLIFQVLISHSALCWRIEGNTLIIEKGDNLSKISHSLYEKGYDYRKLWNACIDTGFTKNPNLIYEDMRFNLDSMTTLVGDTAPVDPTNGSGSSEEFPVFVLKPEKETDWASIIISGLVTIVAAIVGGFVAYRIANNQIKKSKAIEENRIQTKNTFDFHREFNKDLHDSRVEGDRLLIKNEASDREYFQIFMILNTNKKESTRAVFVVFNFYNRLWLSIKHKQVCEDLIPELFGDIFMYWYDYCFGLGCHSRSAPGSNQAIWQSLKNIDDFAKWLRAKMEKAAKVTQGSTLECDRINKEYMDKEVEKFKLRKDEGKSETYLVELRSEELKSQIIDELNAKVMTQLTEEYGLKKSK